MNFLKHPAWLWLEKNRRDLLPPVDEDTQAMFDAGHLFEEYAEQIFPSGVKLGYTRDGVFDWNLYKTLPERTSDALASGVDILFQGRVEVDGLTCIFDVLEKNKNGTYTLYEIKSSTSAKQEHEYDLAFQACVLEKYGLTLEKIYVVHINNQYIRKGDLDIEGLVAMTEITEKVRSHKALTLRKIQEAKKTMCESEMPNLSPGFVRLQAFSDWMKIYRNIVQDIPQESIYHLTRIGAKLVGELEKKGIALVQDIPDDMQLGDKQKNQILATRSGKHFVDTKNIQAFLESLSYPLYFLDYETFSKVIPPFDGIKPYQQIPFQYSLHILESPESTLVHKEFLQRENSLPVPQLAKKLQEDIGETGTILTWNKSFEMKCNEVMGVLAPEYETFFTQVNARIEDLMIPFSKDWFVDKDFRGSASLKNVLPVLVPELSYKELDIQGGGTAQRLWMQCVLDGNIDASEEKIMNDLLKYCELDTLAMVRIWEVLKKIPHTHKNAKESFQ